MRQIQSALILADDVQEMAWYPLWWDAVVKEMKNMQLAFEVFGVKKENLAVGYKQIKYHIDEKIFHHKAHPVAADHAGGHTYN